LVSLFNAWYFTMTYMRRFAIIAAVLLVATSTSTVSAQARARKATRAVAEPSYDGRSLSSWVSDLDGLAPVTRSTAAYALAGMGPKAVKAVPALIKALSDDVPAVRFPAAYALGEIGEIAVDAVPALEKLLDDRNDDIGHIARKSLRKITGKDYTVEN